MIYIENTNDVQTIKVYSAVERGSYTNPDSPVNPEGGVTEYEVQELINENLENYYTKPEIDSIVTNIDANFQNYYTRPEVDEIVSNISTGGGGDTPTGGESGKIFLARNDGHLYADYVKEIVERCVTGKLSVVEFDSSDDVQGTTTILNFSKLFRPDFDGTGEEGYYYFLTILYQDKEQSETKTFHYRLLELNGRYESDGMWLGFYDISKFGYICSPIVKPFGGSDGKIITIKDDWRIEVNELNFAIDTIVNGGSIVFKSEGGYHSYLCYDAKKEDMYNQFGDWISLWRTIKILELKNDESIKGVNYSYEQYADGTFSMSTTDEWEGMTYIYSSGYSHFTDIPTDVNFNNVNVAENLNLGEMAIIQNEGLFEQLGEANFWGPVYFNNNTYCQNLNVSGATNVKSLTTNGAVNLKGGVLDEVNIDMRTNINKELKLNGGLSTFEDITYGIACDMKAQEIQITDLYNRNIIAGNNEESINFKDSDKNIIAKVDISGNLYEGETKLSDKYATKEDITAINNTLNQIKLALGIE